MAGESRKQRAAVAAAAADAAAQGLPAPPEEEVAAEHLVYDDYSPVDVLQGGRLTKSFPTFDAAVAEFYSKARGTLCVFGFRRFSSPFYSTIFFCKTEFYICTE
jgi:hypothetical protein